MERPETELGRDWRSRATLLHKRNSVAKADVYLIEVDGRTLLAKTYAGNPRWARCLFGYWGLARECRAMASLAGLPGVPRVYGIAHGDTLLTDYVADGTALVARRELTEDEFPPLVFFQRLRALVSAMHRCGVAHGDMRRSNILRTRAEQPFLIDFTTAVRWRRLNPFSRMLFHAMRRADDFAVAKLQASFYPDSLSDEERQRILDKPWYLALGRFLRKRVYRKWIKQRRWRERLAAWRQSVAKQQD